MKDDAQSVYSENLHNIPIVKPVALYGKISLVTGPFCWCTEMMKTLLSQQIGNQP